MAIMIYGHGSDDVGNLVLSLTVSYVLPYHPNFLGFAAGAETTSDKAVDYERGH